MDSELEELLRSYSKGVAFQAGGANWVGRVASHVSGSDHDMSLPNVELASLLLVMPPDAGPFFAGDWTGAQHGISTWCARQWSGQVTAHVAPNDVEALMKPALRFAQVQLAQK